MWDYDRLNVNGTMSDKAVASSRTHARDARTFYTRWDPVGPVRIAPLVAPVRAVLARPCGPRVALGALRYSRHGPFRRVGTGLSVSIVQIVFRNRDCFEITEISRAFLCESPAGRRIRCCQTMARRYQPWTLPDKYVPDECVSMGAVSPALFLWVG